MLQLVARHELVSVPSPGPRCASTASDRSRTLVEVSERARRVEQREVAADRARRLERVVHRGELGVQHRAATVAVTEPQVLVGGDVRKIPHERRHQRVQHTLHVGRRQVLDQRQRAGADPPDQPHLGGGRDSQIRHEVTVSPPGARETRAVGNACLANSDPYGGCIRRAGCRL